MKTLHNTLYIKEKWGREAWIEPSEEAWAVIGASSGPLPIPRIGEKTAGSRFFGYFKTPHLEKYKDVSWPCGDNVAQWRQSIFICV